MGALEEVSINKRNIRATLARDKGGVEEALEMMKDKAYVRGHAEIFKKKWPRLYDVLFEYRDQYLTRYTHKKKPLIYGKCQFFCRKPTS